jgi:hypothetical protein
VIVRPDVDAIYSAMAELGSRAGYTDLPQMKDKNRENCIWIERLAPGKFTLLCKERGQTWTVADGSEDDVLFHLFVELTTNAGIHAEISHEAEGGDSRRHRFAEQARLLGLMRDEWRERYEMHAAVTLKGSGGSI